MPDTATAGLRTATRRRQCSGAIRDARLPARIMPVYCPVKSGPVNAGRIDAGLIDSVMPGSLRIRRVFGHGIPSLMYCYIVVTACVKGGIRTRYQRVNSSPL